MSRNLPPLNALRAFESTVRLKGISNAAVELSVTPGAVSRQIKTLEHWLGLQLFIRHHRQLTPTPFAAEYVGEISQALDIIDVATRPVVRQNDYLTICCFPTFTQRWLMPRWKMFMEQNSSTEVRLKTSMKPLDGLGTDHDACVCIGTEATDWGDWIHIRLFDIVTIPVCSPELISKNGGSITVADLPGQTLLRGAPRPKDWPRWIAAAGIEADAVKTMDCEKGPLFENQGFAIQAAMEGMGILIADRVLVAGELERGQLVQPFGPERKTNHSFYFVFSKKYTPFRRIEPIVNWIQSQSDFV